MTTISTAPKRAKTCTNCRAAYLPRSGVQKMCDDCRSAGPADREARKQDAPTEPGSPNFVPANDYLPFGGGASLAASALSRRIVDAINAEGGWAPATADNDNAARAAMDDPESSWHRGREMCLRLGEIAEAEYRAFHGPAAPVSKYLVLLRIGKQYPEAVRLHLEKDVKRYAEMGGDPPAERAARADCWTCKHRAAADARAKAQASTSEQRIDPYFAS